MLALSIRQPNAERIPFASELRAFMMADRILNR
jgi:hypothetical protein